jgi:hypothetical protein
LFGSQLGGSYPLELAFVLSAFVPPVGLVPDVGGVVVDEEEEDEEVLEDEIGGGLADKVTFVPSRRRSKAC